MILHIDHIAIASRSFEEDIKLLESVGYRLRFLEKDLPNLSIKQKFLGKFKARHDLALLDSIGSISIEVLNYGHIGNKSLCFSPLIETSLSCLEVSNLSELKCQNISSNIKCNKIFLRVKNIRQSIEFWKYLGFNFFKHEKTFTILSFSSLLSRCSYHLYLKEVRGDRYRDCFLDYNCFSSLAFISSSIEKDREFLIRMGLGVTEIERLILKNKVLAIFFIKGPNGEIIEMIGIESFTK